MKPAGRGRQASLTVRIAHPYFKRGKPAPDCFALAETRLGVAIEDCLVFEDSAAGIQAFLSLAATVTPAGDLRIFRR